jgi:hypothetical protein
VISRWPFYASLAVLVCECLLCFFAASMELGARGAMAGVDSGEAAEQTGIAIGLFAIGALNVFGFIAFLLGRWGWWLAFGIQVGIFVLALVEGVLTDLGWFFFSSLPLLTGFLLFGFRIAHARLKSPAEPHAHKLRPADT